MNREIKFRIWDGEKLSYTTCPNKVSCDNGGHTYLAFYTDKRLSPWKEVVIQRFTGLKDKNGKEIYEGDIVRICVNDDPEDLQWELIPITFEWGSFWVGKETMAEFVTSQEEAGWEQLFGLEVVGNIFENPELIKK